MKKFSYLAVVLVMVTLVGCGNTDKTGKAGKLETVEAESVEESVEESTEESSLASEESENSNVLAIEDIQYAIYITDCETSEFGRIYSAVASDSNTEKYNGLIRFSVLEDAINNDLTNVDDENTIEAETDEVTLRDNTESAAESESTASTGTYTENEIDNTQLSIGSYYIVDTDGMATMSIPPQMRIKAYRLATDDEIVEFNLTREANSTFEEDFERIRTEEPAVAYGDALRSQYTWSYEQIEVFKAYIEEQKQISTELKDAWEQAESDASEAGMTLGY